MSNGMSLKRLNTFIFLIENCNLQFYFRIILSTTIKHFESIALLSSIEKVYERIIQKRLGETLEEKQ